MAFSNPEPEYIKARDEAYSDATVRSVIKGNISACSIIGIEVSNIMVRRLNGEAMSVQMSEPNLPFYHFVIKDAYSQEFYRTDEMKMSLVREFREKYELECYGSLGSNG